MEDNLKKLKESFSNIKETRENINEVFELINGSLIKLTQLYLDVSKNGFFFGLDSFQFQNKLLNIENEDMKRLFLVINNRIYCEYYKLYKMIAEYVKTSIPNKKILELVKIINTFPIYKDLEPYKEYNFELVQEIHENIIILLYEINDYILNKENELSLYQKKQDRGLNINNFVSTFNYNILMVKEKGMLFISYLNFFHNLHKNQLDYFLSKIKMMHYQISTNITFEDNIQLDQGIEENENKKMSNIFKKNVKKVVNFFKQKKDADIKTSIVSNDLQIESISVSGSDADQDVNMVSNVDKTSTQNDSIMVTELDTEIESNMVTNEDKNSTQIDSIMVAENNTDQETNMVTIEDETPTQIDSIMVTELEEKDDTNATDTTPNVSLLIYNYENGYVKN